MVHITHILFIFTALLSLSGILGGPLALLLGIIFALGGWVPTHLPLAKWTKQLLAVAIVLLGFRVAIPEALTLLQQNIMLIGLCIGLAFLLCVVAARLLGVSSEVSHLLGAGTAICGGSAIAAVAPVIRARNTAIGVALGCVFVLNALALWLFPLVGHWLELSQQQFGIWAAVAIHDTASVVAAAHEYGDKALATATTLKLSRALAIIPMVFIFALLVQRQEKAVKGRVYFPWFIAGFVITAGVASFFPSFGALYTLLAAGGKHLLTLSIFLIGASLSLTLLRQTGWRAMAVAVIAWLGVSIFSLLWVLQRISI